MIVIGVILMLIGLLTHVPFAWTIGLLLVVVGAVLWLLGAAGRPVGGRSHYW